MRYIQNTLIGISLLILATLPLFSTFGDIPSWAKALLYEISFGAVFLLMIIRPLADIFPRQLWLRKSVVYRKGLGILSASVVVGFLMGNLINPYSQYFAGFLDFQSIGWYGVLARVGDITGLILLLTSNTFSVVLLRKNWKRIQKLAYLYFYSGGLYHMYISDAVWAIWAMGIVTTLVLLAFVINKLRRRT